MFYFLDANYPNPIEPKVKRRKGDAEPIPYITVEKIENKQIRSNFLITVNCWDFIIASEHLQRGEVTQKEKKYRVRFLFSF